LFSCTYVTSAFFITQLIKERQSKAKKTSLLLQPSHSSTEFELEVQSISSVSNDNFQIDEEEPEQDQDDKSSKLNNHEGSSKDQLHNSDANKAAAPSEHLHEATASSNTKPQGAFAMYIVGLKFWFFNRYIFFITFIKFSSQMIVGAINTANIKLVTLDRYLYDYR